MGLREKKKTKRTARRGRVAIGGGGWVGLWGGLGWVVGVRRTVAVVVAVVSKEAVMQTSRDGEIVEWVGRIGAANAEQVIARFGMGRTRAYERLRLLVGRGLLTQRTLLYRQAGLYTATRHGLRWQGLSHLGVFRVSPAGFEHAVQVATAAVELEGRLPEWRVVGEREIRFAETDTGELAASARVGELPDGSPALHRPDLALIGPRGEVVAVEIELSVKSSKRLRAICRGWARARHVSHVYYLASRASGRAVQRTIDELDVGERITVLPLAETRELAELAAGRVRR